MKSKISPETVESLINGLNKENDEQSNILKICSIAKMGSYDQDAHAISGSHFCSSIKEYLNVNSGKSSAELVKDLGFEIERFSRIYKDIHTVKCHATLNDNTAKDGRLTVLKEGMHLGQFVLDVIEKREQIEKKQLLLLRGPVGSYKNRLLQYIYLYLYHKACERDEHSVNLDSSEQATILPIYIDMARYENNGTVRLAYGTELTVDGLLDKLGSIVGLANKDNKAPVIIFDNVRSFVCGLEDVYNRITSFINNRSNKCWIVTGVDTLIAATNRKYCGDLANWEKNYENVIKISSLNLDRERESEEFIGNCIDIFKCNKRDPKDVRDQLIDLRFVALDAYNLKEILNYVDAKAVDKRISETLAQIYAKYLGADVDEECIHEAFLYDYDESVSAFPRRSIWWKFAVEHRSLLDYLVAKYYHNCLKQAFCSGTEALLPDVALTNSINRFLRAMLTPDEWVKLVLYVYNNLDKLSPTGASSFGEKTIAQLIYLIGRVPSDAERILKKRQQDVVGEILGCLKSCFEEAVSKSRAENPEGDEVRINHFLLRTVLVDMIKRGNKGALNEYLKLLIADRVAADVNVGYHLDYYGDVTVEEKDRHKSLIGVVLTDLPHKGVNTLRKLGLELEADLENENDFGKKVCMITLNMFTYCELITKRSARCFDNMSSMQEKCLLFLNSFLELSEKRQCGLDREVMSYFYRIRDGFERSLNKNPRYFELTTRLSKARTGWLQRGVNDAESISTHMYNAWLMASIYLPEEYDGDSELEGRYDKEQILRLLLVHDVGEAIIGDIVPGEKSPEQKEIEKSAVASYIKQLFPAKTAENLIFLWNASETAGSNNINARIAKDIDHIQAVYQYCCYVAQKPALFNKEDWDGWARYLNTSTQIGANIVRDAILDNVEFQKISQLAQQIRLVKEHLKENK